MQQTYATIRDRVSRGITSYRIPTGEATSETEIKRSVFVGTVSRAGSVQAAQAFVETVRTLYADANHNAWAYRIDDGPQGRIGSSDDGEPGGTAGRPMLAVLEGSGLCEVVAVGTRYFGGTKLGTGGLVRAYSGAVREALVTLPTQELVWHRVARFEIDYGLYGTLRYLLPRLGCKIADETFGEAVTLEIVTPHDQVEALAAQLQELTNGAIELSSAWSEDRYEPRLEP